jgi:hypothetical protein
MAAVFLSLLALLHEALSVCGGRVAGEHVQEEAAADVECFLSGLF